MTENDLIKLIGEIREQKCEKQRLEIKEAHLSNPKRLYDTLSAFANQSGGGTIVFGISERQGFEVVGVYDAQDLQAKVTEQCKQMSPPVRPFFTVAEIDGKMVVSAAIPEADIFEKPCFYTGVGRVRGSYRRVGEEDVQMTEYEVYSFEAFRRKIHDELRVVERAGENALDEEGIERCFAKIASEKPNIANFSIEQFKEFGGLVDGGKPTLAGVMLFGYYPQAYFPQLVITAVVVEGYDELAFGEEERFVDNKRIDGTIPQMLEGAMTFIKRNMRQKTIIDDETGLRRDQPEYPTKALREIVLNSLIHRDYSIHTDASPIRIIMYRDRLEVENPGGLYGRLTIDKLGLAAADTRNPYIATMLEEMKQTENRFSGIPTIRAAMKKVGLPPPVFASCGGTFKVTLFCGEQRQEPKTVLAGGETATDSGATLVERILEFCKTPRSKYEISEQFNFCATYYLIAKYIRPLIEEGKLALTMPQTPKSKNQKYVTRQ